MKVFSKIGFIAMLFCAGCISKHDTRKACGIRAENREQVVLGAKRLFLNRILFTSQATTYARDKYGLIMIWPEPVMLDTCWIETLDSVYFNEYGLNFNQFELKLSSEVDSIAQLYPPELNYDGTYNFVTKRPQPLLPDYNVIVTPIAEADTLNFNIELIIDTSGFVIGVNELDGRISSKQDSVLSNYFIVERKFFSPPIHLGEKVIFRYSPLHIFMVGDT
ncbi:MAG: hypothetical protein HWE24_20670 [Oceanospirillaceae bacterium]|nr:hypothetical protein [Oceanospirillaceae bacterium]